jgi:DNA-binding transcriptional ArsR family regulator
MPEMLDAQDMLEMEPRMSEAAKLMEMLSQPVRLRILCILLDGEQSVLKLADMAGLSQPAMSHHLRKLRDADLVNTRRDAQTRNSQDHLLHVRLPLRDQRAYEGRGKVHISRATATTRSTRACSAPRAAAGDHAALLAGAAEKAAVETHRPARLGRSSRKSNGTRRWTWPPTGWQGAAHRSRKLAFFTGRDQSQS